jgi:hypothetical protein
MSQRMSELQSFPALAVNHKRSALLETQHQKDLSRARLEVVSSFRIVNDGGCLLTPLLISQLANDVRQVYQAGRNTKQCHNLMLTVVLATSFHLLLLLAYLSEENEGRSLRRRVQSASCAAVLLWKAVLDAILLKQRRSSQPGECGCPAWSTTPPYRCTTDVKPLRPDEYHGPEFKLVQRRSLVPDHAPTSPPFPPLRRVT